MNNSNMARAEYDKYIVKIKEQVIRDLYGTKTNIEQYKLWGQNSNGDLGFDVSIKELDITNVNDYERIRNVLSKNKFKVESGFIFEHTEVDSFLRASISFTNDRIIIYFK